MIIFATGIELKKEKVSFTTKVMNTICCKADNKVTVNEEGKFTPTLIANGTIIIGEFEVWTMRIALMRNLLFSLIDIRHRVDPFLLI